MTAAPQPRAAATSATVSRAVRVMPAMVAEGRPIAFQREPVEGSSVWLCGMVNMADGAGSEDKVYDYVNAYLSAESAPALVASGYGSANAVALAASTTPEELTAAGLGQIAAPVFSQLPITIESRDRHAEEFETIKSGF